VFRLILNEMLATTRGAVAALFLDWEGETVELVCDRNLSDHELRITGAYQAIFLTRLRDICASIDAGSPHRYKIEFERMSILSWDLRDGYYLVLLVDDTHIEASAWRRMENCRRRLLAEM
jgi:hypothetical protein